MAAGGEVAGGMEESNKEVMAFRYEILLPNMPIIRSVGLGGTVPNSELTRFRTDQIEFSVAGFRNYL